MLGAEQRAASIGVGHLALVQSAVVALLVLGVLGELLLVGLRGVGDVTQANGLRVLFVELDGLGLRLAGGQRGAGVSLREVMGNVLTLQGADTVTPRQVLQRPRPRSLGSGLPSPVLKLA